MKRNILQNAFVATVLVLLTACANSVLRPDASGAEFVKPSGMQAPLAGMRWNMSPAQLRNALDLHWTKNEKNALQGEIQLFGRTFQLEAVFYHDHIDEVTLDSGPLSASQARQLESECLQALVKHYHEPWKAVQDLPASSEARGDFYAWRFSNTRLVLYSAVQENKADSIVIRVISDANVIDPLVISAKDMADLKPDFAYQVWWRGHPFWVLRRTPAQIATARKHFDDPAPAKNALTLWTLYDEASIGTRPAIHLRYPRLRSMREDVGVYYGYSPLNPCELKAAAPGSYTDDNGKNYPSDDYVALVDHCLNMAFDVAGRAVDDEAKGVQLLIPPHHFTDAGDLVIGR